MIKKLLIYAVRVTLFSVILFAFWLWLFDVLYLKLVGEIVRVGFGVVGRPKQMCEFAPHLFFGIVPFLALGLSHKMKILLKLKMAALGLIGLFVWHVLLSGVLCEVFASQDLSLKVYIEISFLVFNSAVPLALWIALYRQQVKKLIT